MEDPPTWFPLRRPGESNIATCDLDFLGLWKVVQIEALDAYIDVAKYYQKRFDSAHAGLIRMGGDLS